MEYLIKQHDALLQELSVIIRNEDKSMGYKSIGRELRYSAVALLTVLAGSENKIIKDQILEQHKYIQTLPKILIQETENDIPLKLVLVTAIQNFVNGKPKDFLKEQELIQELCKYIDAFLDDDKNTGAS